jgi:hypothetical protein
VQERRYELRRHALDVGFAPQQWSALVRGYGTADPQGGVENDRNGVPRN